MLGTVIEEVGAHQRDCLPAPKNFNNPKVTRKAFLSACRSGNAVHAYEA